jgi:hypothetical protein
MAGNGLALDLAHRLRIVGGSVAAGEDDLPLGEVLAGGTAETGLARDELLYALRLLLGREGLPLAVLPQVAVTGMEEDAVVLADLLDSRRLDMALTSSAMMMPGLSVEVGMGSGLVPRCLVASSSTPLFIGAQPNASWLQGRAAVDPEGFVLTGSPVRTRRARLHTLTCRSRPALRACSRSATCVRARPSASPRRSARAAVVTQIHTALALQPEAHKLG